MFEHILGRQLCRSRWRILFHLEVAAVAISLHDRTVVEKGIGSARRRRTLGNVHAEIVMTPGLVRVALRKRSILASTKIGYNADFFSGQLNSSVKE